MLFILTIRPSPDPKSTRPPCRPLRRVITFCTWALLAGMQGTWEKFQRAKVKMSDARALLYKKLFQTTQTNLQLQGDFSEARLEDSCPHGIYSKPSASGYLSNTPSSNGPGLQLSNNLIWCVIIHSSMQDLHKLN